MARKRKYVLAILAGAVLEAAGTWYSVSQGLPLRTIIFGAFVCGFTVGGTVVIALDSLEESLQ